MSMNKNDPQLSEARAQGPDEFLDLKLGNPSKTAAGAKAVGVALNHVMSEMNPEMEQALKEMQFPGPEIDMDPNCYARVILSMLDIPVHKLANNKSLIESLHVLFTLFSEFRQNQHFKNQEANGNAGGMGTTTDMAQF